MTSLPMNLSPEEFLKYHCIDPNAEEFLQQALNDANEARKELQDEERHREIVEEQLGFAKDLLEEIQEVLKDCTTAKEIKSSIKRLIGNSYVEI